MRHRGLGHREILVGNTSVGNATAQDAQKARDAIQRGRLIGAKTERERFYIEAIAEYWDRFADRPHGARMKSLAAVPFQAILAAKQTTKTILIVMVTTQDPVATGIIENLARPKENITGLARLTRELGGKRLELLKEAAPSISKVGVIWAADDEGSAIGFKHYETAARELKLALQSLEVRGPQADLEHAFKAAAQGTLSGLITIRSGLLNRYQKQIVDFAIESRLPSIYDGSDFVEAGGLMSYNTDDVESFKRAAVYTDKILKGAKPAELPVEQPNKFELVINLKTAKQIGLTIPPNVLARADRVIK